MPAREDVTLVARAAMGATYCVWSTHHATTLGLLRQVVAMRGGAAPVTAGPAADLLAATRRKLIAGRSGVPSVGADQTDRLRTIGEQQLRGVLPCSTGCRRIRPSTSAPGWSTWPSGWPGRPGTATPTR